MQERDDSPQAIRKRYTDANLMSIVTSSRQVFESLQDIPRLLSRVENAEAKNIELEHDVRDLQQYNLSLRAEVLRLGGEDHVIPGKSYE